MGSDCLAHVFWGVLDDSCRQFSNPLSPEVAQEKDTWIQKVFGFQEPDWVTWLTNWHVTIH